MLGFSGLISRNSFRGFEDFQGCLAGTLDRDETRERGRARVRKPVGAWGRLWAAGAVHKPADFCRAGVWAGARVRFLQFYVQHPASPQSFTRPQPPDSPPARRSPRPPIIYLQLRLPPTPITAASKNSANS